MQAWTARDAIEQRPKTSQAAQISYLGKELPRIVNDYTKLELLWIAPAMATASSSNNDFAMFHRKRPVLRYMNAATAQYDRQFGAAVRVYLRCTRQLDKADIKTKGPIRERPVRITPVLNLAVAVPECRRRPNNARIAHAQRLVNGPTVSDSTTHTRLGYLPQQQLCI